MTRLTDVAATCCEEAPFFVYKDEGSIAIWKLCLVCVRCEMIAAMYCLRSALTGQFCVSLGQVGISHCPRKIVSIFHYMLHCTDCRDVGIGSQTYRNRNSAKGILCELIQ